MTQRNAPLPPEGRRRLIERCASRPIAHVAAEMGISRACASKGVNRYRRHGELGLLDRPSTPRQQVERYNRILAEEFLYARTWTSEDQRRKGLAVWNIHYNYYRPPAEQSAGRRPLDYAGAWS
ncbi:helix-turn-helix domain-containing protein [Streptomyces sp. YU58]|uniref:helix-turn-helix domain-containing protein n=1 Tax=Streptomyces sp. SX92 TaxID=3158972 RepID=UPI0027BA3CA6|nr:leucine zipper domain-containing protein [Streptomyces coralus]WLW58117.1 leucine zipper domain-containing protein [Streptomyces coralus]